MADTVQPTRRDQPPQPMAPDAPSAPPPPAGDEACWVRSSRPNESLRWLTDEFADSFAAVASSLLRADLKVRLTGAAECSRAHLVQALEELTCTYVVVPDPPESEGPEICLEFSPAIAMAMIERLLGASAACPLAISRPLTAVERRVLHRLAKVVAVSLAGAWPGSPRPGFRAELRPIPTTAARSDRRVAAITFELSMGRNVGTMRLCGDGEILDEVTRATLRPRTGKAPLELTAALEGVTVDDAELAELAVGDIIATEIDADGEIVIRIGGIPKFAARLGLAGGKKVLTITRRLDGPAGE